MAISRALRRLCFLKQHVRMCSSGNVEEVLLEKLGDKGVITLNRPQALNALTLPMIHRIHPQLKEWESSGDVKMILIKGAGSKAFCAGGDVVALTKAATKGEPLKEDFMKFEYKLNNAIDKLSIPYVALIDGVTMGGGVGLSVHGHFRVATERTLFAMPETAIGLFPDVGGGYFLPRLSGQLGTYLALTGHRLKGPDVLKAGIATHFVQSTKIDDLEKSLLELEEPKFDRVQALLLQYQNQSSGLIGHDFSLADVQDKIDSLFAASTMEEIMDNLAKEGSEWSQGTMQLLQKMSPTSLKITLRQLIEGANMSLEDVLKMEYRLCQRCIDDFDLHEGIRAVLLERDHSPMWKPATLKEVTQDRVDHYFSRLPEDKELHL